MAGYSGLDFGSVHDELAYWLGHTSSYFKGGFSGSGENGNDFAMPTGTPVYAVTSGTVVGAGYYGGGGVVSIQQYPGHVWYYQHLDENVAQNGQQVAAGELIGFSGGQNSGGQHPASPVFSGYPHIEVGLDAPWGGIWGGGPNVGPNIDPRPALEGLFTATATGNTIPTNGNNTIGLPPLFQASVTGPGGKTGLSATQDAATIAQAQQCVQPSGPALVDPAAWAAYFACLANQGQLNPVGGLTGAIGQGVTGALQATGLGTIGQFFAQMLGNWQADLGRVLKFVAGSIVVVASILIFILPDAAAALVSVAGAPEAAPGVRQAVAHPLRHGPRQIVRGVTATVQSRAAQRQQTFRQYRYAREAQVADVRRQQVQQIRAQRGAATRPLGPQQAPPTNPLPQQAPPTSPVNNQASQTSPWRPGLGMFSRRGVNRGLTQQSQSLTGGLSQIVQYPPGTAVVSQPAKPQRAPKTGLVDTFRMGYRRLFSREPIPDAEVVQTKQDISQFFTPEDVERARKRAQAWNEAGTNAPGIDDIMRSLRGETGQSKPERHPGTETTLQAEESNLASLREMLSKESDPTVAKNLRRDIAAIEARIVKMEKERNG